MHVVTDDERREAAERLRDEVGCGSSWPGMERLGLILGIEREPRTGWEGRILTRLADFIEPDDPPYNLYTLYEAVFHRSPRCWECIEDDEVNELVDALLDLCNSPGHECIQRFQPSEPEVRCVAEVKVDGERLEKLAHDAVVEVTGIDRDALLALADEMEEVAQSRWEAGHKGIAINDADRADRIRKALGGTDG